MHRLLHNSGKAIWLGVAIFVGCDVEHVRLLNSTATSLNTPDAGGGAAPITPPVTGGSAPTAGAGGMAGTSGAGSNGGSEMNGGAGSGGAAGAGGGGAGGTGGAAPCSAFGPWLTPEPVLGLAEDTLDHWGPSLTNAPTVLFYSVGALEDEDIWRATRNSLNEPFTAAMAVSQVNTDTIEATPFIMPAGQALWFSSTRPGGLGDRDIWMAPGGVNGFAAAINVTEVNSDGLEHLPSLTADGLILVFASTRVDSANEDIFMATRGSASDSFPTPEPVDELNTPAYDSSPAITADALTIYFTSKRNAAITGTDIYYATRSSRSEPFGEPQEVVELNSDFNDEDPRLSPTREEIFFASNRDNAPHRIWHALRECLDP